MSTGPGCLQGMLNWCFEVEFLQLLAFFGCHKPTENRVLGSLTDVCCSFAISLQTVRFSTLDE